MTKLEELLKQQLEITTAIAFDVKKCEEAAIKGDSEKKFLAAVTQPSVIQSCTSCLNTQCV